MGIQALLGALVRNGALPLVHISTYSHCSVAIDGAHWLYRALYPVATKHCLGLPTTRHTDLFMERVNMLRSFGIKVIVVFDGARLPAKAATHEARERSRLENFHNGLEALWRGRYMADYTRSPPFRHPS